MNQNDLFFFNKLLFFVVIIALVAAAAEEDEAEAETRDGDTPEFDGASWKLTDNDQGLVITFFGNGLSGNQATSTYTGTVDSISVHKIGAPAKASTIQLPVATKLQDLADAANDIPGTPNPKNAKPFLDLLMPKGSPFPDLYYTGSNHANFALGFGGDDQFDLKGGKDTVYASKGDDTVLGGNGADTFNTQYLTTSANINLQKGKASYGAHGATLNSVENAVGTGKGDKLTGSGQGNTLKGRQGDDVIGGGGGNDKLFGDQGKDVLRGGAGKDLIEGGARNDKMFGGAGADTFRFSGKKNYDNGVDRIKDWQTGTDMIKITGGKKSEITVSHKSGDTHVKYDEGKIILENVVLDKGDIDFMF